MSEEKQTPIGLIVGIVAVVAVVAFVVGKGSGKDQQASKPTEPEKPAEPQEPAFMKEGLVTYYPFNGDAKDESGNGNDGKATDVEYVKEDSGVGGKAAKFSEGSTIRASAEKLPQGNSPASISCLVKVTGATRELHIAGWGDRGINNSVFALFGDGFDTENGANAFLAWTQ